MHGEASEGTHGGPQTTALKRTPFYEFHKAYGGRMVDFGGWDMPVQFAGILHEHQLVRSKVGLFDVSHMGEVRIKGAKARHAVHHLVTNDVMSMDDGQVLYTTMCNDRGGIIDDLLVYRINEEDLVLCVNASNREKDFAWMVERNPFPDDALFMDQSHRWAQIALQGRHAETVLQLLTEVDLSTIRYYRFAHGSVAGGAACAIARTGYTGEDGFEVFMHRNEATSIWPALMEVGQEFGLEPIGLGARDTLRLEARMCLYGNDINDQTTPLEAGLGWVVKFDCGDFIGRDALLAQKESGVARRLVCLEVQKRIARPHCPIMVDGQVVGEVTSGTKSPTLNKNIAMGYVPRRLARPGNQVAIDIRGRLADAVVVKPPFFKRSY